MIYDAARIAGHRGFGANAVVAEFEENTTASCLHALAHGADMVEVDANVSSDGVAVAYHNSRTPDGRLVREQTAAELREKWGIEPMADLLAALPTTTSEGRPVGVNLEIKTGYDVNEPELRYDVLDAVAEFLPEAAARHVMVVSSFDPEVIRRLRAAIDTGSAPRVPLGYLVEDIDPRHRAELVNAREGVDGLELLRVVRSDAGFRERAREITLDEAIATARELRADALHPQVQLMGLETAGPAPYTPEQAVARIHAAGLRTLVWCPEPDSAVRLLAAGAEGVCVNRVPATAAAWAVRRAARGTHPGFGGPRHPAHHRPPGRGGLPGHRPVR